jgi:hypothetical protein
VGITEEKQSAYMIDLLGGAPVEYIEEIAFMAMYSKRQYIMPFENVVDNLLDSATSSITGNKKSSQHSGKTGNVYKTTRVGKLRFRNTTRKLNPRQEDGTRG